MHLGTASPAAAIRSHESHAATAVVRRPASDHQQSRRTLAGSRWLGDSLVGCCEADPSTADFRYGQPLYLCMSSTMDSSSAAFFRLYTLCTAGLGQSPAATPHPVPWRRRPSLPARGICRTAV